MKKIIGSILCFLSVAVIANSRDVVNFNDGWVFGKSISNTEFTKKISLPHSWRKYEGEQLFNLYRGGCQYLKEFTAPYGWSNKNVYVRFYGVATIANIFVNGRYVGEHRGAYTAFTFDITPFLKFGTTNTIMVYVDNSVQLDVMPLCGDFNVYGGIYRDVEVIVTDKTHISTTHYSSDGVYVKQSKLTKKSAEMNVDVVLNGQYGDKCVAKVSIYEDDEVVAVQKTNATIDIEGSNYLTIPFSINDPRVWNGKKDPFLYRCKVELYDMHDVIRDQVEVTFGVRSVSISRTTGFLLNGENYPLYGVTYMQDRDDVYSAYGSLERREDMDIIEEIGATAIRTPNAPHHKHIYEMTDRNGIIAWVDLPFTGDDVDKGTSFIYSMDFINNGRQQFEEMVYQLYNHPSIAFWGLFSNIAGHGDSPISYLKELNELSHKISPNVMTVGCSNEDGAINNITDAISWSQYFGWRSRSVSDINTWLNAFRTQWTNLKPAIGEYGAGASIYHQYVYNLKVDERDKWHPEIYQTNFHLSYSQSLKNRPYMWGYFVNSLFDYGSSHRFNGDQIGLCDMGLVTYNRHTRKDAFYLYKALWNTDDEFVYITQKRIARRKGIRQNITVFSSCRTVDLIVNGVTHSTVTVINGSANWANLLLKEGHNVIVAQCGEARDKIEIDIFN